MFGLWRENNLFGLSSIFTRIFLSVCRRLLPTCLPHLKNWQQVQLVPQKVLQILLIECRICRCNCICLHVYIYILLQQTLLLIFIIIYCCCMGLPKLAASGVHCSSHRGAWREASVCQGESHRSSCHEGSYVSGSKAIQNISKLSLGCLMVMFTLMHPHMFEIFNQLNQFEVRRRRRCKRWVFAMESVARPLKP